jgi:hypothetical protein
VLPVRAQTSEKTQLVYGTPRANIRVGEVA